MTVEYYEPTEHDISYGSIVVNALHVANEQRVVAASRFISLNGPLPCPCCYPHQNKVCIVAPGHHGKWNEEFHELFNREYQVYYQMDEMPFCPPQEPKDVPATVRGNGRQRIVDNGKHSWPGPKLRKGHR